MAKSRTKKLDFSGVEVFNAPAEGVHKVKIAKVEETTSQGGNDMFKVTFVVVAGPSKGSKVIENYPLVEAALWKLKSLLEAIGMKADGRVAVDLDKMEGKTLEIEVKLEEYEGKDRVRVAETRKVGASIAKEDAEEDEDDDDFDEDEEEDEEDEEEDEEEVKPAKKSKKPAKKAKEKPAKKAKKKPEPEPEEEDDDDDDWDDDDWDDEE